ncbi:hypothetical protein OEZ85_010496 [Tetradesmus obliquus]|uniref:Uncharacterized protein n=1 Tax=Tetradesmus obliquus TaxID=3088 RepID=A0ABY8TMF9_TETOB|nr:hypothetical protein OEZ85_010496 [Tetradesmus obliquus]
MMLVQAPQFNVPAAEQARACSEGHTIQHPVLFLMRVDPENAFHNLETVVSVFAALATLQLQPQQYNGGLEVVIADDRVPGYFSAVWRRLSHPHPLRVLREQPFPAGTCFATALLAPYTAHTQSLLTYKAGTADEVAELSELPFYPDQISLLMRTGVLMGVHGAGLANQVFMKPRLGAVVEVWHNMENNFHYHNLAYMLGHCYFNVRSEQELDVQAVVAAAVAAMDAVAAARAAVAAAAAGSGSGSWWWRRPWQG